MHVAGKLIFHAGQPVLIECLGRCQGLHIRQGVVQRLPLLFAHIEDGALLHQIGQCFLCAALIGGHFVSGGNVVLSQESELCSVLLKLHDFLPQVRRHPGGILSLFDFSQQVEIMNVQGQKARVFGVSAVGTKHGPVRKCGPLTRLDFLQIAQDGGTDTVLCEGGIFSAWILKPLLPPQTESQTVSVADLVALVLHEQEEVAQVIGVLNGLPEIRLKHGAKGGLTPGLTQPLHIAHGFGGLSRENHREAVLPAQPV